MDTETNHINVKKTDLLSASQRKTFVLLADANLRERTPDGILVAELIVWTYDFSLILRLYPSPGELHPDSVIAKYIKGIDHDDEPWGDDEAGEVQFERLEEFHGHLKSLKPFIEDTENGSMKEAYEAILEICESTLQNKNQLFFQAEFYQF